MKNRSMLEDERKDEVQKALKKNRCKYLDGCYATVGHVYSVMVEMLNIKNPDIHRFIEELNEYIEIGGDGFACVKDPTKQLYSRTFSKLAWYLSDYLKKREPEIENRVRLFVAIMKEASGGYNHFSHLEKKHQPEGYPVKGTPLRLFLEGSL